MQPLTLDWIQMLTGLCGGLALFLFGMQQMGEALKAAAGFRMKQILARLTSNRVTGAITGAFVTAVIQSSSVTTVLVVGFVSAGVMTLNQSIGVIMGANLGTTITAQIIAFKITKLALVLVAVGFAADFFHKSETVRQNGRIILGLGLIFLGMNIMGEGMAPLRDYQPFIDLMRDMARPGMGILCGAIFTALIQSSSAATGIVVIMAAQGFISLPAGIAMAMGANVGTCVTAMLAATGKSRPALRAASIHVLFNLLGVLLWVAFIDQLTAFASFISPVYSELAGIERIAAEAPRQIANANTIFNLVNTLVFISLTGPLAGLVTWLLPDRPAEARIVSPLFLDDQLISTPSLALNVARLETGHLGDQILKMMLMAQSAMQKPDRQLLQEIEKQDDAADILHAEINVYLNRVGKETLTDEESNEHYRIGRANAYLESIGDVLETDLASLGYKWVDLNLRASETMQMLLNDLFDGVFEGLECAVKTIKDNDLIAAQKIISMKSEINLRVNAALEHQAHSLAESGETRLETLNAEFELTDKLKRIFTLSKRIARLWVPKEV